MQGPQGRYGHPSHSRHHAHGQGEEVDKICRLELGADDYVTKPFSPRELVLRINRSLRRGKDKMPSLEKLTVGETGARPLPA